MLLVFKFGAKVQKNEINRKTDYIIYLLLTNKARSTTQVSYGLGWG